MIFSVLLYLVVIFSLFFTCVKRDLKVQKLLCGVTVLLGKLVAVFLFHFIFWCVYQYYFWDNVSSFYPGDLSFSSHQFAHYIPRFGG